MTIRQILTGTALLMASALPATFAAQAQVAPDLGPRPSLNDQDTGEEYRTPETLDAGRQMGGPAGDVLAEPADPTRQAEGQGAERSTSDPQPGGREATATNVITPPASPGEDDPGSAEAPGVAASEGEATEVEPAETNIAPATTIAGTRGGGALAEHQIYANDLSEYQVVGTDGREMGEVAGVVVDLRTGRVDTLILSQGGFAGMGDAIYDLPWGLVAGVDKNEERVLIDADEAMLRPNPEFRPGGEQPGASEEPRVDDGG